MQTVSIAQAQNQFASLLQSVELGEEVVLTRHGKPVARLVPESTAFSVVQPDSQEAQVLSQLAQARQQLSGVVQFSDWKTLRDEGRRI
jgi:prevent-host-death family protein